MLLPEDIPFTKVNHKFIWASLIRNMLKKPAAPAIIWKYIYEGQMLEVKTKLLNALMFGLPNQELKLFLGKAPDLEAGTTGLVKSNLLGDDFTGGMGTALSTGTACLGIIIDTPQLPVDRLQVQQLHDAGLGLTGAYNACAIAAYNDLAMSIAKNLFKDTPEPTLKIHFGQCGQDEHDPQKRSVEKVEIIMRGIPTGHPMWSYDTL